MASVTLAVLMGLPGSGKTSFCKRILRSSKPNNDKNKSHDKVSSISDNISDMSNQTCLRNYITICYDSLISLETQREFARLAADGVGEKSWKLSRDCIHKNVDTFLNALLVTKSDDDVLRHLIDEFGFSSSSSSFQGEVVVLLDDNFYYESMRRQYFDLAFKFKIGYCQVYFKCSTSEAIKNNSHRDDRTAVPEEVILTMASKIEEPTSTSWEKFSLTLYPFDSLDDSVLSKFYSLLAQAFECPADTEELAQAREMKRVASDCSRVTCSKSVLHQCDLILRTCVSEIMKTSVIHKGLVARAANSARQTVLADVKAGYKALPLEFQEEFSLEKKGLLSKTLDCYFHDEFQKVIA